MCMHLSGRRSMLECAVLHLQRLLDPAGEDAHEQAERAARGVGHVVVRQVVAHHQPPQALLVTAVAAHRHGRHHRRAHTHVVHVFFVAAHGRAQLRVLDGHGAYTQHTHTTHPVRSPWSQLVCLSSRRASLTLHGRHHVDHGVLRLKVADETWRVELDEQLSIHLRR